MKKNNIRFFRLVSDLKQLFFFFFRLILLLCAQQSVPYTSQSRVKGIKEASPTTHPNVKFFCGKNLEKGSSLSSPGRPKTLHDTSQDLTSSVKVRHGPLMNRLKQFCELFHFREDYSRFSNVKNHFKKCCCQICKHTIQYFISTDRACVVVDFANTQYLNRIKLKFLLLVILFVLK